MRAIRFVLLSALFIFVGIPCLFVALILGLSLFGVVLGIGIGLFVAVIKIALVVILPVALLMWLFGLVFARKSST